MLCKHIVEDEIKMRTENDNSVPWAGADKYGYLGKQGGKNKVWHKRWFVVKDSYLFYFKKKGAPEPLAMIPLQGLEVDKQVGKGNGKSQNFCIRLVHQDKSKKVKSCRFTDSKQVNNGVVLLLAASEQECGSWVTTLKTNLTQGLVGISSRQDASGGSSNSQGNMNSNLAPRTSHHKSGLTIGCAVCWCALLVYRHGPALPSMGAFLRAAMMATATLLQMPRPPPKRLPAQGAAATTLLSSRASRVPTQLSISPLLITS